jgi:uncharacterized protein DUF6152
MIRTFLARRSSRALAVLWVAAFGSATTSAHHSFAAEFDIDKPVELQGKVVRVELINPHSWIHLEVTGSNGAKETWMIEGGSPNQLLRKGFTKNSVPVGAELRVTGYQARDGAKRAVGRTLKLANGQPLFFESTPIPERRTEPAAP